VTLAALYEGRVWHRRHRPKAHVLRYDVLMTLLDLSSLPALDASLRLFSVGRFNLFDFRPRDHLQGRSDDLKTEVDELLDEAGLARGGRVRLLCMPRVLGAAFNPLSLYFCDAPDGSLQAILYEVNNTFGQRHVYLIPARAEGGRVEQECEKAFYVSPFNPMALRYAFTVTPPGTDPAERPLVVRIEVLDADGPLMTASFSGAGARLTDRALAGAWLRHPLLAAKVLGAIHFEALKIWLKGVSLTARPPPPARFVTLQPAAFGVGERVRR
jgi:DUF1365 family protein